MIEQPLPEIRAGVWEHYKGERYVVIGIARDDRDETPLVIYLRLYGRAGLPMTARPLDGFLAQVETAEGLRPRFRYVGTVEPERS